MPKKQTPRQIHKQYEMPNHPFKVAVTQKYIKVDEQWTFNGYLCIACDNRFRFAASFAKHEKTCKVLNRIKDNKT